MRHRDQAPPQAPGPPPIDPASAFRAFLAADPQLVIRAAPAHRLRPTLTGIAAHLCNRARPGLTEPLSPVPVSRAIRGASDAQPAKHADVQHHHASQIIAASCLHVLGFDSHQAAAADTYFTSIVEPTLAAASRQQLRGLLLSLAAHVEATMDAADTVTTPYTDDSLPGETQETGTGMFGIARLCQHATMIQAAHLQSMLLDGLTFTSARPSF